MPWINGQWINETPDTNPNMRPGMAGQETVPFLHNFPGSGVSAPAPSQFNPPGLAPGGPGSSVAISTGADSGFNPQPYLAALAARGAPATASSQATQGGPFNYNQTLFSPQGSSDQYGVTFGPGGAISPQRFAEITAGSIASQNRPPTTPPMGAPSAASAANRRYGTPSAITSGTPSSTGPMPSPTPGATDRSARIRQIQAALAQRAQPFRR